MSDAARRTAPDTGDDSDTAAPAQAVRPRWGLMDTLNAFLRGRPRDNDARERVEDILDEKDEGGALSQRERGMLRNLLKFGSLKISDVMVPRADIVAVPEDASLDEVLAVFKEAQHSRLPVYHETLDEPLGMVHLKDLVGLIAGGIAKERGDFSLAKVKREVLFVPPTMSAQQALLKMQQTRIHIALVIDEFGGTDGLVSIEDLIEQIVGDIDDEHDTDEDPAIALSQDGVFEADARVPIEEVERAAGVKLAITEDHLELDTIGGLVGAIAGRVPEKGAIIHHPSGVIFDVIDADPRRVKRVRVRRVATPPSATAA